MSDRAVILEPVTVVEFIQPDTTVVVASASIGTAPSTGGGGGSTDAADIDIADADGNFTATNVEDALAELADDIAGVTGATDLSYTASTRVVASSTGTDATLTLADGTNPGLMSSSDYTKLAAISGTNTGDQDLSGYVPTSRTVNGSALSSNVTLDADDIDDTSTTNKFVTSADITKLGNLSGTNTGDQDLSGYATTSALSSHESDTTSIHGIADTSALETTTGSQAKVDTHVNDTTDAHDASAISIADAGTYYTGTNVEAALQEVGADIAGLGSPAAGDVSITDSGSYFTGTDVEAALQELGLTSAAATGFLNSFAGVTVPPRSLDRFGAGPGITSTTLTTALTDTTGTTVVIGNSGLTRSGVAQKIRIDDEIMFVPAASAGASTLTSVVRGVDGSTAATHSAGAKVSVSQVRQAVIFGDSTEQGTIGGFDTSSKRLRRTLAGLMGGDLGLGFRGCYRDGGTSFGVNTSGEWVHSGTFAAAFYYSDFDLAPRITISLSSGTSNYSTWTRPIDETVRQIDVIWYNYGSFSGGDNWSYSLDGGSTWIDNPYTPGTPGTGRVVRSKILCNNPTSIRIRAANAAGTGQGIYLLGVDVWSQPEDFGNTTGFKLHNIGVDGSTLSGLVRNTICVFDGVTNGTTTLTSATAAFSSNDVGRVIRGTNIPDGTTISAYGSATSVTLSASATGSATGGTVWVQGGAGDWAALLDGHQGSLIPDLVFCGKWTNDAATEANTGGQQGFGDADTVSFGYCLDTFLDRVTPYADVVCSAPFEQGTVRLDGTYSTAAIQAAYRAKLVAKAAAYEVASIDEFAALTASGITSYADADAAGLMNDYLHPSAKLYREIAARRDRVLTVLGGVGGRRSDLSESLLSTAGQITYRDSSGLAAVTAPSKAGQRLKWDGSAVVYSEPEGYGYVASDVTHTQSNTSLSDVTGLAVPIGASATEIWFFEAHLLVSATTTAVDITLGFSVPTSCTMQWGVTNSISNQGGMTTNSGATPSAVNAAGGTQDQGTFSGTEMIVVNGWIFGGGTSGNVQLRFAQRVSDASDLKVLKGSMLRYRRLAS